jgi:hypothetical protein
MSQLADRIEALEGELERCKVGCAVVDECQARGDVISTLEREKKSLNTLIEALEAALRPFAAMADVLDERHLNERHPTHVGLHCPDEPLSGDVDNSQLVLSAGASAYGTPATLCMSLHMNHFRDARRALEEGK